MGLRIAATGISLAAGRGSTEHALAAAGECLAASRVDVDLLVYLGIYRDENVFEPAIGALLQQRLGIHPDYVRGCDDRTCLSFDLANGQAGLLTGIAAVDALFAANGPGAALLIAADSHPAGNAPPGFPFACCGAAVLLTAGEGGFGPVRFHPGDGTDIEVTGLLDVGEPAGRSTIAVDERSGRRDRMLDRLTEAIGAHLRAASLSSKDVLVAVSPPDPKFAGELAARLDVEPRRILGIDGLDGEARTAGHAIAYHQAGARVDRVPVLFAADDICAATALYLPPR